MLLAQRLVKQDILS